MSLPRWLAALFVDPEFDAQMQAYDHAEDVRRVQHVQSGRMSAPLRADKRKLKLKLKLRRRAIELR